MIVLKSTYDAMRDRALTAEGKYRAMQVRWNALVHDINKKGGRKFLDDATLSHKSQFSKDEITKLILLCHPDKHDGKQMATEITQKLLKIKAEDTQ